PVWHAPGIRESHKDPIQRRGERDGTRARDEDAKGRRRVRSDEGYHGARRGHDRIHALRRHGVRLTQAMRTGRSAAPMSAETVIVHWAPRFIAATEKIPVPVVPGIWTIPSWVRVAARATMSGPAVVEADSSRVSMPETIWAAGALAQTKFNRTSVGGIAAVGVKANTNVCAAWAGMSTGVFTVPVTAVGVGAVGWKTKAAVWGRGPPGSGWR